METQATQPLEFSRLLQQPEALRDDRWEELFLNYVPQINVEILNEQAQTGPDGWPYLFVRTGSQAQEPFFKVIEWLAGRGIGLVLNPHKMLPDYVFPYGMIWNFVETGRFLQAAQTSGSGEVIYTPQSGVVTGQPSEKYLPQYVRSLLREFLQGQGYSKPKILVVTSPDYKNIDLLVSEESLTGLPKSKHKPLAEMLAWFLPLHYTLVLGSEVGLPTFCDL